MPLDVTKTLIDALWSTLEARSGFTALVTEGARIKSAGDDYMERARPKSNAGVYPNVFVFANGITASTAVKTFGTGSATTTLDYGVPMTVTFDVRCAFQMQTDANVMPLEAEIEAAIHSLLITMRTAGYRWCGAVTFRKSRANKNHGGEMRTVTTWTISVECRPLLSALTA